MLRAVAVVLVGVTLLLIAQLFRMPFLEHEEAGYLMRSYVGFAASHVENESLVVRLSQLVTVGSLVLGSSALAVGVVLRIARLPDPAWLPLPNLIGPAFTIAAFASYGLIGSGRFTVTTPAIPASAICGVLAGGLLSRIANRDDLARVEAALRGDKERARLVYRAVAKRRAVRVVHNTISFAISAVAFVGYHAICTVLQIIALFWVFFVGIGETIHIVPRGLLQYISLGVLTIAWAAVAGMLRSYSQLRTTERAWRTRPGLRVLGPTEVPALTAMLQELGEAMIGKPEPFDRVVLDTRGRVAAPSVVVSAKVVQLVVTPRLVAMVYKSPKAVRAMIAHEIAHLVQRDASLWPRAMMLSRMAKQFMLPMLAWYAGVSAVIILANGSYAGLLLAAPNIVIFLSTVMAVANTYEARRTSEGLADLAAILFVGGAELGKALAGLSHVETDWHEPIEVRRERARRCTT